MSEVLCGAQRTLVTHDRFAIDQFTHDQLCTLPSGHKEVDTGDGHWCPCDTCADAIVAGKPNLVIHAPWPTYWTERRAQERINPNSRRGTDE